MGGRRGGEWLSRGRVSKETGIFSARAYFFLPVIEFGQPPADVRCGPTAGPKRPFGFRLVAFAPPLGPKHGPWVLARSM